MSIIILNCENENIFKNVKVSIENKYAIKNWETKLKTAIFVPAICFCIEKVDMQGEYKRQKTKNTIAVLWLIVTTLLESEEAIFSIPTLFKMQMVERISSFATIPQRMQITIPKPVRPRGKNNGSIRTEIFFRIELEMVFVKLKFTVKCIKNQIITEKIKIVEPTFDIKLNAVLMEFRKIFFSFGRRSFGNSRIKFSSVLTNLFKISV